MKQSEILEFESTAFPVSKEEDQDTNPGIYGKALAAWIAEQLKIRNLSAGEVVAEDFGWCVPVEASPCRLYVACSSTGEKTNQWRVFAFVEGGLFSRLLGRDKSSEALTSLISTVKKCLESNPAVQGLSQAAT